MKVYGIHTLTLRPDASEEEMVRSFNEAWTSIPEAKGWRDYLLKGMRGQRAGEYIFLLKVDSLELFQQAYPLDGQDTPETLAYRQAPGFQVMEELGRKLAPRTLGYNITDYIVIADEDSARQALK